MTQLWVGGKGSLLKMADVKHTIKPKDEGFIFIYINNLRFQLLPREMRHKDFCLLVDAPPENSEVSFQYDEDMKLILPIKIKNGMHFIVTRLIV